MDTLGSKYDRQLRLWNTTGQQALNSSHLLLINVNTVAAETLKNLVLPGLSTITILDNTLIQHSDYKKNFFFHKSDLNSSKSLILSQRLAQLNPDITVNYINNTPLNQSLIYNTTFWSQFDILLYTPTFSTIKYASQLQSLASELNIPYFQISSLGSSAYLISKPIQQLIIQTHQQQPPDLRIDRPWPQLQSYINSISISPQTNDYNSLPYSIILTKLHQISPKSTPADLRNQLNSLYPSSNHSNILEAYNKAYLIMTDSTALPHNLSQLFNHPLTIQPLSNSPLEWFVLHAIASFYKSFNLLPHSGTLPDMESHSEQYITLKSIYTDKFNSDVNYIFESVNSDLANIGRSCDKQLVELMVKNCRNITLIEPTKSTTTTTTNPILSAFLTIESFQETNNRHMTQQDLETLTHPPTQWVNELARANGTELHTTSAILGGIAAQEIIKAVTNQYVPVNNTLVFDGISSKCTTFIT